MTHRYRFLISWRWLGVAVLAIVLTATCVWLGIWQHGRYEERAAVNDRIAAAEKDDSPRPVVEVTSVDKGPADADVWSKVTATGQFDTDGEVLIRNRGNEGRNGYEVVTPMRLDDGTAVLVNRGWVPASDKGATALPEVPAAPAGDVRVDGQVRASEERMGGLNGVSGSRQARSINTDLISQNLDYALRQGYLADTDPPDGLKTMPVDREAAWQNFAYAYQWWLFAAMIPVGVVMIARREAKTSDPVNTHAPVERSA